MSATMDAAQAIERFTARTGSQARLLVVSPDFRDAVAVERFLSAEDDGLLHGVPWRVDTYADGYWVEVRGFVEVVPDDRWVETVTYHRLRFEPEDLPRGNDGAYADPISPATGRAQRKEPP